MASSAPSGHVGGQRFNRTGEAENDAELDFMAIGQGGGGHESGGAETGEENFFHTVFPCEDDAVARGGAIFFLFGASARKPVFTRTFP
jgi:hypothetical protein